MHHVLVQTVFALKLQVPNYILIPLALNNCMAKFSVQPNRNQDEMHLNMLVMLQGFRQYFQGFVVCLCYRKLIIVRCGILLPFVTELALLFLQKL